MKAVYGGGGGAVLGYKESCSCLPFDSIHSHYIPKSCLFTKAQKNATMRHNKRRSCYLPNRTPGPSENKQDHNVVIEPPSLSDLKLGSLPRRQTGSLFKTKRKAVVGGVSGEEETHQLTKLQATLAHRFL